MERNDKKSTIPLCTSILHCICLISQRVSGTGRLLFEMVRGVQKQFFSSVDKVRTKFNHFPARSDVSQASLNQYNDYTMLALGYFYQ